MQAEVHCFMAPANTAAAEQYFKSWAAQQQMDCCVGLLVEYALGALHGQSQVK